MHLPAALSGLSAGPRFTTMKKQTLSRHSVGPQKAYTPTPLASGWMMIRVGFQLIGRHIGQTLSSLFYRVYWTVAAVFFLLIGIAAALVVFALFLALFLALCFATGWAFNAAIDGFISLIELILP